MGHMVTPRAARAATTSRRVCGALSVLAMVVPADAERAARAQVPPGPLVALTLDEALAEGRAHQPRLRVAMAEYRARLDDARVPRGDWLPQIGATAQLLVGTTNNTTASYLNVPEVNLPRIGGSRSPTTIDGASLVPGASTLVAASLGQEVYDFGRISARIAAADALAEAAQADAEVARLDTDVAVEETFDAVLAAHQIRQAAEDAWKRARAHRDFAEAGSRSGMRPPVDLTRAEAELAQAEVRRLRATSGLQLAQAALAASIGSTALGVDARSDERSAPPSPALGEALELALRRNPAIAQRLAQLRAEQAHARAVGRELWPNLFGSATVSGRAGGNSPSSTTPPGGATFGDGWVPYVVNWSAGLVLQWNLFDATVLARRDAARARADAALARLDETRLDVQLGVQRAFIGLRAAEDALPSLAQSVQAARANEAQAEARFKAGLGTSMELADAEALLTTSEVELAIGRFSADRARAQLARALGGGTYLRN